MKMYVLVRNDISKSQQAVQAGHALAQFMLDWPDRSKEWNNYILVYLRTDLDQLQVLADTLIDGFNLVSDFYEPDLGNELTAIAVCGSTAENYLSDFRLM